GMMGIGPENMMWAVGASNIIWGTAGFFVVGLLTKQGRWMHLWLVSLAVWLVSLMNVAIMGASLIQWAGGLLFILLMMGIGGGVASLIQSEEQTEPETVLPEEPAGEALPSAEEIAPGVWFYEKNGRHDGPVTAGRL